jgi:suppressor of tumorigenicity protein 13
MSTLPANTLEFLESFVKTVSANPAVLHHPDLLFFKNYLESIGATLPPPPPSPSSEPVKPNEAKAEEVKEEDEEEEEVMKDDGLVAPDSEPFPELPNFGAEGDYEKAGAFKQQGQEFASSGKWSEAIDAYSSALSHQPSGMTLVRRAKALLKCTPPRPNAAVRDASHALAQNPDSATAMKVRGRAVSL